MTIFAKLEHAWHCARALAGLKTTSHALTYLRASSDNHFRIAGLQARLLIADGRLQDAEQTLSAAIALYSHETLVLERPETLRLLAFVVEALRGKDEAKLFYLGAMTDALLVYAPEYASAWRSAEFPSWFLAEFVDAEDADDGKEV